MISPDQLIHRIGDAGGRLRVKSALNPALWFCGIVASPLLVFAASMQNPPNWLIATAILPVVVTAFGFVYLLFVDRDKLQSEDYQIRKKSLELIQEKGQRFAIAAASIEAISNPQASNFIGANDLEDR